MATYPEIIATLKTWSADAATTNTNWPTMTNAQKDAANREVIRRLGFLCDHLVDFIQGNRAP